MAFGRSQNPGEVPFGARDRPGSDEGRRGHEVLVGPGEGGRGSTEANPYNLAEGDSYFVVHAEMVLPHRWVVM